MIGADDLRKVATSGMLSTNGREHNEQAQGLFANRGKTNERGKRNRGKSRSKSRPLAERPCFKCGELEHFKAYCPNKRVIKKNNNNNSKGKQQEKQEASYVSNDEDDYCYSVSEQCNEMYGKWMLDSEASHHMCPNRKWFTTYQSLDGGTVLMGNDHACKTVGSMAALSKAMVQNDGDVRTISNTQVVEIESKDQPDSSHVQEEHPIVTQYEEDDELDHEEVQQENAHVLQQQQQESLATTRPKRSYKPV
ncbi:hypothetical protein RIF29_15880 [Crotalaria pallida]|uniref:CCHC-type domain-containing protein n=1 Tax=Crotalaria pallida TaxID=3830 RepID=A0AAN9IJE9_CROPI